MTREAPLDLLQARVKLRDRSVSDVLDLALRFLVDQGRSYGKVALLSLLPLTVVSLACGTVLGWTMAWFVAIPLAALAEIPFTLLASQLVFQDRVRARDVMSSALRSAPKVLLVRTVAAVAIAAGAFVLVIPAFWLGAIFFFLTEVMLLERSSVRLTFRRSQRIAGSAMSDIVLGILVLSLVPVASVLLADVAGRSLVGELLQFRPPRPLWSVGGGALPILGLFAQVPYFTTARFFLYLNVRTRTEGWDIQTRFAAIAARAETSDVPRGARGAPLLEQPKARA